MASVEIHLASTMKRLTATLATFTALLYLTAVPTNAQQTATQRQDVKVLQQNVQQFLRIQSAGLPGKVDIAVGGVDPRLILAACPAPESFLPTGSRVWGNTTVGVRCTAPSTWTIYVPAKVTVIGEYLVTAAPLAQGQTLEASDVAKVRGDLTSLPPGIVTDLSHIVGRQINASLPVGTPLRSDALRSQTVVKQGQVVRLVTSGPGFQISAEGRALTNAAEGETAQARTPSGQLVTGIAKLGGVLEIAN